jgi:hypothetical protein
MHVSPSAPTAYELALRLARWLAKAEPPLPMPNAKASRPDTVAAWLFGERLSSPCSAKARFLAERPDFDERAWGVARDALWAATSSLDEALGAAAAMSCLEKALSRSRLALTAPLDDLLYFQFGWGSPNGPLLAFADGALSAAAFRQKVLLAPLPAFLEPTGEAERARMFRDRLAVSMAADGGGVWEPAAASRGDPFASGPKPEERALASLLGGPRHVSSPWGLPERNWAAGSGGFAVAAEGARLFLARALGEESAVLRVWPTPLGEALAGPLAKELAEERIPRTRQRELLALHERQALARAASASRAADGELVSLSAKPPRL